MTSVSFLDLVDDPAVWVEYDAWHQRVFPEVLAHIRSVGITSCDIYRAGNRLVMVMESAGPATTSDGEIPPRVAEWEALMDAYQVRLPWVEPGQKWCPAELVFSSGEFQL